MVRLTPPFPRTIPSRPNRPCGEGPSAQSLLTLPSETKGLAARRRPATARCGRSPSTYMLQCLVAINVSKSSVQRAGMAIIAAALGFIAVFAVPAS